MLRRARLAAAFAMGIPLVCGCGPSSDGSRALQQELAGDSAAMKSVAMNDADVLELVQERPAPDGDGSTSDWLRRETSAQTGSALFPRWTVQRRTANRFEVRFTFTWVEESNEIENRGFVWQVNGSLRSVEGPQELKTSEPAKALAPLDQQERRAKDPEYNLY